MTNEFYSYAFRALLAEEALDRAGRRPNSVNSTYLDLRVAEHLPFSLMDEDFLLRSRRMAVVFIAISSFESSVRTFVSKVLLEVHGENWWNVGVSQRIRAHAKTRQEEESKIQWHTPRGHSHLNYIDFGDLSSIISQNWEHFAPYLNAQEWAKHILETLELSRNIVMHSGELGDRDIERVGMLIQDWLQQVGS